MSYKNKFCKSTLQSSIIKSDYFLLTQNHFENHSQVIVSLARHFLESCCDNSFPKTPQQPWKGNHPWNQAGPRDRLRKTLQGSRLPLCGAALRLSNKQIACMLRTKSGCMYHTYVNIISSRFLRVRLRLPWPPGFYATYLLILVMAL